MNNHTRTAVITAALTMGLATASQAQEKESSPSISRRTESGYRDGTYKATGQYGGQPSFITVETTLKGGIISDVKVTPHAYVPRSLELQQRFAAAVPKVVVGRPIDEVKVGKLAGSSGTPQGFNAAVEQIKKQAAR